MAGRRVDEVVDNVFAVSGRINSTWGGGLVDMVRSRRLLEIIERDGLIEHAAKVGDWLLGELAALGGRHAGLVSNVRGRGLMCAFDLPDAADPRRGAAAAAGGPCSCAAVRRTLDPVPAGAGRHRAGARVRAGRAGPHPDYPGPLTNKGCYRWISAPSASVIAGRPVADAPGGRIGVHQPGATRRGGRRGRAGRRGAAGDRGPSGARRAAGVGGRARAGARPGDRAHRPPGRGQQAAPGRSGHPRDRQAVRRGARRGPGDHRHLRLLPRRGPAAVRPDRAQRDARQAAVHVPHPSRRGGGRSPRGTSRSRCRPGTSSRAAVRQHRRVEAGRVLGRRRERVPRAVLPRRRAARRRAQRGATPTARPRSPAWSRRWTRA